jgi:hypothetical protein
LIAILQHERQAPKEKGGAKEIHVTGRGLIRHNWDHQGGCDDRPCRCRRFAKSATKVQARQQQNEDARPLDNSEKPLAPSGQNKEIEDFQISGQTGTPVRGARDSQRPFLKPSQRDRVVISGNIPGIGEAKRHPHGQDCVYAQHDEEAERDVPRNR